MTTDTDSIITVYDPDGIPLIVDGKATKAGEYLAKNSTVGTDE